MWSIIFILFAIYLSIKITGRCVDEAFERGSIIELVELENVDFPTGDPGENSYTDSPIYVHANTPFDLQIKGGEFVGVNTGKRIGIDNFYVSLDNENWKQVAYEYITLIEDHQPDNAAVKVYFCFSIPIGTRADNYKGQFKVRVENSPWEWLENPTFILVFTAIFVTLIQGFNFVMDKIIKKE